MHCDKGITWDRFMLINYLSVVAVFVFINCKYCRYLIQGHYHYMYIYVAQKYGFFLPEQLIGVIRMCNLQLTFSMFRYTLLPDKSFMYLYINSQVFLELGLG